MYKELQFRIRGIAPLIMHNGQLADPLNEWAKALKKVSGKRDKTEDDHLEMSRIEFYGGLYVNAEQRPVIPGPNIESLLVDGSKVRKLGKKFKAAIISDGDWPLEYDGPKTADELWADKRFVDRRGAPVGGGRIQRTRPIFRQWGLRFSVSYLPSVLNPEQVKEALQAAGQLVGLCDYKPRFGRFEVL